jgi:hypothetical protein
VFFFPFAARDRRRKLQKERAVFFFPFAARDRRRKLQMGTFFPFAAKDRRRKLQRELFFLLLPGTGGGNYTRNFFSFCCQGLFLGYGFQDLDGQIDRHCNFII